VVFVNNFGEFIAFTNKNICVIPEKKMRKIRPSDVEK